MDNENIICPNAANQTLIFNSKFQFGFNKAVTPPHIPGKVNAYTTMIAIIMNNNGINTETTLEIPLSRAL